MASPVNAHSQREVSSDLTVRYGCYHLDATPVVVQGVLHEAGRLFTGAAGMVVTLFDARGRSAIASVESESLTLTHIHPSFTNALLIAAEASTRGDLATISDLISLLQACKDKHQFHLDNHSCSYTLRSHPVQSSSVSERTISVRGVVESNCIEHDALLPVLQNIYMQALERQGMCRAPVMTTAL